MSAIITQAESLLRDVSNHGVTSIEKVEKIDRLLIKMDRVESEDLLLRKLYALIQKNGRDIEGLNSDTDKLVWGLLEQLGYDRLVETIKTLPSW